jgi:hypothetical protein
MESRVYPEVKLGKPEWLRNAAYSKREVERANIERFL